MTIRPYQSVDAGALIRVFRKNVPHAFGEAEEADYAAFLDVMPVSYFIAEHDGQVAGACGYYIPPRLGSSDAEPARIVWILSDPDVKGQRIGSGLLTYCLDAIREQAPDRLIECRTSQVAYRFFEQFGFRLQYTRPDFWVQGLDLYYMTRNL